ncbi:hypothetical protein Lser_V15G11453 [Lactuca serriola]
MDNVGILCAVMLDTKLQKSSYANTASYPNLEELFTEMGIITKLFMCGFLLKVHKNFFYNDELIARIHGLDYGISLVLVIYLLGIHPLSLRELQEELGLTLPNDAFELLFVFLQQSVTNNGNFINNEFDDVYLVTTVSPIPLEAFTLPESEVSAVKYISIEEYKQALAKEDPKYVPYSLEVQYSQLFEIIMKRYHCNVEAPSLDLQKKLNRYAPISLTSELTGLTKEDKEALMLLIHAVRMMDDIFHQQVLFNNPSLREWLKGNAHKSHFYKLKWSYYSVNKSPWSCLDENEAFFMTADSAIRLLQESTKSIPGWNGIEYKAAFPMKKPSGANFYPSDLDKMMSDHAARIFNPGAITSGYKTKQVTMLQGYLTLELYHQATKQNRCDHAARIFNPGAVTSGYKTKTILKNYWKIFKR